MEQKLTETKIFSMVKQAWKYPVFTPRDKPEIAQYLNKKFSIETTENLLLHLSEVRNTDDLATFICNELGILPETQAQVEARLLRTFRADSLDTRTYAGDIPPGRVVELMQERFGITCDRAELFTSAGYQSRLSNLSSFVCNKLNIRQ